MAIALHHSRAKGAAKLVLLGIANHDGDGGAWPSVATLSKYAQVTPRQVQKLLSELERLNEVRRLVSAGGDHSMADFLRPNLYHFLLQCPPDCDRSRNHRTRRSAHFQIELEGVSPTTGGVAHDGGGVSPTTGDPLSPTTPKPSTEPTMKISQFPRPTTDAREAADRFERIVRSKCSAQSAGIHKFAIDGYCVLCGAHSSTVVTA